MFKTIWENKTVRQMSYFLLVAGAILLLWILGQKIFNFENLFEEYELKTYDLRAQMAANNRLYNKDIVILAIDDDSLEVLQDDLGRFPWSRDVYAKAIKYLQKHGVDIIAFDLMFVGHQRGFEHLDKKLVDTIAKYDNVYVSMNFDHRDEVNPPELPEKLTINVENNSKDIDYKNFSYPYARLILDEIIESTDNIGFINFNKDHLDGVSRRSPTFFKYNNDYYPYLAIKVASDYIKKHEKTNIDKYVITEDNKLIFGNRSFSLDENGSIIINWYGQNQTFNYIPFWKVYKGTLSEEDLKNKIVIVGSTAVAMYDIKNTPVSPIYPGVEILATVINNILDNESVKRVGHLTDLLISLILSLLVAFVIIKIREPLISSFIVVAIILGYIFAASYILDHYLIWVGIVSQIAFIIMTFTIMFVIKYVLKAKDFEYTYKLATTDGLTDLYNHRYFQEKLKENMKRANRFNSSFSLVLIDIDFFKKFNDTYGHQAGDEVLRQVGQALKKAVKPTDLVARYGGEEMVIILSDADTNSAIGIADRICKTIADKQFKLAEGLEVNVTISLGVASYPIHGKTSTELIEFADKGLYRAKENGRNQVGALEDKQAAN